MRYYGFLELFITVLVWLVSVCAFAVVPYVVLRLRDSRNVRRDPQLGIKVAMHFLMSVGVIIAGIGATMVLAELIRGDDADDKTRRVGTGLFLAGLIIGGLHLWLVVVRTNDRRWPSTRRTFIGIRFIIAGLVYTVGLCGVLAMILVGSDAQGGDEGAVFIAMLMVWGGAWIIDLLLLLRSQRLAEVPGVDTHCVMCDYDLRGTPNPAACSECGTAITTEQRELLVRIFAPMGAAGAAPSGAGQGGADPRS